MKNLFKSFNNWLRKPVKDRKESGEKFRSVMLPGDIYLTQEGQMILPPIERIQTFRIK